MTYEQFSVNRICKQRGFLFFMKSDTILIARTSTPLLLTGTIDSSVYNDTGNLIKNLSERLQQYESSIEKYICETPFNIIVFIENSGYSFDERRFEELAHKHGKEFEFISGKICKDEILQHRKSFGDAYLVAEALEKSKLLKHVDFFYKISGRIFLKNAKAICKTRDKYRNEFIVYQGKRWCFTNIFKASKEDYLRVLGDVYLECDEATVNDIEISFYKRLAASDISMGSFETYPYFDGIMGATGERYSGAFVERVIRNIMARLHFFSMNSRTAAILEKVFK